MTMATTVEFRAAAQFNPSFRPVNDWRGRYRIMKGSAGSGKSVNVAQDYIAKLSDPRNTGANLLVVRKIEETNRDSTFAELQAAIYRMFGPYADRFWKVNLNPLALECRTTGNRIIFRGVKDQRQREKVKSITFKNGKLVWIWCEEATELLSEDVDILDDRLRGNLDDLNANLFYQITMTFNPVSATHWIKGRYFDKADPDVLTHHSTYKENRFIDAAYYRRMERRAIEDPEGYRVYGLGEWGELGGLILTNFEVHDFKTGRDYFDGFYYGQDFGFNHADAILGIGWKDGEIYICSEIYVFEKDTEEIITLARTAKVDPRVEMFCDSAEPDRIKTWQKAGFRAQPVKKEPGSVKAQIDFLKGRKIHIHPSCVNTLKEVQQWKWKKDPTTGLYIDEPVEFMDDAMAALRYPWSGAMFSDRLWQNKQALLFNVRETITQGVMQGKSVAAMSKELSARMGQSYKNAERLIRTETTHFHSEADKAAYGAAGVDEYEYVATLDSRTSTICADLDGKHFKVKDAQAGVNYPPMHPNCRSTTVEYDPDDTLDWYNSGLKMPRNMTYSEWAERQGVKHTSSPDNSRKQLKA